MSLEAAVLQLDATLNRLIAQLGPEQRAALTGKPARDTSEDTRALTTEEKKKAIENAKSQKADDAAREALQKARDAAKTPPAGLSYDKDVKGWALALAKKNRQALLALYEKYGVKVGVELKPEQLAPFKVELDAACKAAEITSPAVVEAKK